MTDSTEAPTSHQYIVPNNKPSMMPTRDDLMVMEMEIKENDSDQKIKNDQTDEYKSNMHQLTDQEVKKLIDDNKLDQKYYDPSIKFYQLPLERFNVTVSKIFNRSWYEIYQLLWYLEVRINKGSEDCFHTSQIQRGDILVDKKQAIVRSQNSIYLFQLANCQKFEDDRYVYTLPSIKKEMIEKDLTNMNTIYEKIE